jgi:DNA (cytosine-5)-methyltransferase 1
MSQRPLAFYEFFAGGGMARLGLGDEWACLFANDFDAVKAETYRANFEDAAEHFHQGDVWKLRASQLPGRADLAWASSPCQDFSLAGARAGLKGGRSSAFFGFWKLIEDLAATGRAPNIVVIENVAGLLTSHDGRDFESLCRALTKQGYRFGALEIDAQRFVPQSRPRVFVIGVRAQVPDELWQLEPTPPFHSRKVQSAFERLPKSLRQAWIWWSLPFPPMMNERLDAVLEPDDAVEWFSDERTSKLKTLFSERHEEKLRVAGTREGRSIGTVFRRMRVEDGKKIQRAELRFDGYAGCLRTPAGGSSKQFVAVVEKRRMRCRDLTIREAARLMGLGEAYRLPKGKTSALKVIGDGVAVPVVKFLAENLLRPLAECHRANQSAEEAERQVAIAG